MQIELVQRLIAMIKGVDGSRNGGEFNFGLHLLAVLEIVRIISVVFSLGSVCCLGVEPCT